MVVEKITGDNAAINHDIPNNIVLLLFMDVKKTARIKTEVKAKIKVSPEKTGRKSLFRLKNEVN